MQISTIPKAPISGAILLPFCCYLACDCFWKIPFVRINNEINLRARNIHCNHAINVDLSAGLPPCKCSTNFLPDTIWQGPLSHRPGPSAVQDYFFYPSGRTMKGAVTKVCLCDTIPHQQRELSFSKRSPVWFLTF